MFVRLDLLVPIQNNRANTLLIKFVYIYLSSSSVKHVTTVAPSYIRVYLPSSVIVLLSKCYTYASNEKLPVEITTCNDNVKNECMFLTQMQIVMQIETFFENNSK